MSNAIIGPLNQGIMRVSAGRCQKIQSCDTSRLTFRVLLLFLVGAVLFEQTIGLEQQVVVSNLIRAKKPVRLVRASNDDETTLASTVDAQTEPEVTAAAVTESEASVTTTGEGSSSVSSSTIQSTEAATSSNDATSDTSSSASGATATTAASPDTTATGSPTISSKISQLNFTEIEEKFWASQPEQQVVDTWKSMDKKMVRGIRDVLSLVFPKVTNMAQTVNVSSLCSAAIFNWVLNLRHMRSWAVKMLDASGKPSAGLLSGSLTMFGDYKQCLSVRAPDEQEMEFVEEFRELFRGKYCVLQVRPALPAKPSFYSLNSTIDSLLRSGYKQYEKTTYDELAELAMAFNFVSIRADLCVPSVCSRDDIQRVASYLVGLIGMRARVQRCEAEPVEESLRHQLMGPNEAALNKLAQELKHPNWDFTWLVILIALMVLVVFSSWINLIFDLVSEEKPKGKMRALLCSMSMQRSLSHMRHVQLSRIEDTKPSFLYTLRLIIVFWFCLCQLTRQLDFQFLRQLLQLRSIIMLPPMQLLVNSSFQFDTLIFLTAFTYAYQSINSNLMDLIKYNVAKYSRLAPSVMVMTALTILVPSYFLRQMSPTWTDFMEQPARQCRNTGIVNAAFLQNLLGYDQICLPHTWLFCVELQLCVLTIPLVYWLNRNFDASQGRFRARTAPVLGLMLAAIAGCVINYVNIRNNQLPGAWFETYPDKQDRALYFGYHLQKTWAHLSPFAIGLLAGHLCRSQSIATFSGRPYGKRTCDTLMWLTALVTMAAILFSTHTWSISGRSHLDQPVASALYGALAPLAWSIACAMLLFYLTVPNSQNQVPGLARLLAAGPLLVRLGRLSFLVYLVNPFVNQLVLALQEQAIFTSVIMLGHTFLGNLVASFILAATLSVLVELPCRRLVKKLALGSRRHCSNLGIIARQLNIRQNNQGPSHDSFTAQQQSQVQFQQNQHIQYQNRAADKQRQPVMIALK